MARPASDIAERLVHAARARFLEEGVEGASLRAIARDAGTNLGMVYYYFPSKDELFLAVVEEVYGRLLDDIALCMSQAEHDARSQIERLYARFASLSEEESQILRLVMREAMGSSSARLGRLFERFMRGHVPLLLALVNSGREGGELRADLPPFVMMVGTLALGLLPQLLRRRLGEAGVPVEAFLPQPEQLASSLANVLFSGIAAQPFASKLPGPAGPEVAASCSEREED